MKCGTCLYWSEAGDRQGLCKRYAPKMAGEVVKFSDDADAAMEAVWPITEDYDYCGEYIYQTPPGRAVM